MKTIYITEQQRAILQNEILLTESSGERALKEYIKNFTPFVFRQYFDTPLRSLPEILIGMLNPGEGESNLFKSVANNTEGHNTFFDLLRLNFYEQFGIRHGSGPTKYLKGLARIAIGELGFYSFSFEMKADAITNLTRVMNIITYKQNELAESGLSLDSNLNGFSYNELIEYISPFINRHKEQENYELENGIVEENGEYTIRTITDTPVKSAYGTAMFLPVGEGKEYLISLSQYTDWCICNPSKMDYEYGQYTSNGGKFYICEKRGFKSIERVQGENCPLDEYGLSLIGVLIDTEGFPVNITTRWNHDYSGENNKNLWLASQLQKILKVNFKQIFKPRSQEELMAINIGLDGDNQMPGYYSVDNTSPEMLRNLGINVDNLPLNEAKTPAAQEQVPKVNDAFLRAASAGEAMEEGAEPEANKYTIGAEEGGMISHNYHVVNEDDNKKENALRKYCEEIEEFMRHSGLNVHPYPEINFDWSEQNGLFIRTGYYTPEDRQVTVFCKNRHPKDILRSFAHEMIHHYQNLEGKDLNFSSNDDVKDNKELEKLEGEAYLKGNLYFRKWTEYKNNQKMSLKESIDNDLNMLESTEPENIDLSSFNIKKELNPKFWKNGLLDSRIRIKLMDIADDFIDFLNVDWVKPDDVIITGSLANFNWNKEYSDIDLHILIDFSKVDKRKDFVKKYFDSQKNLWNEEHSDLSIFGFPVEVYVQDTNESHTSTGVYSLEKNEWITEPKREKLATAKVNKDLIRKKVADYINKIDDLEDSFKKDKNDDYKLRKLSEKLEKLLTDIKNERKNELNKKANGNEISNGNIIFKCLRRLDYIDKLYDLKTQTYDKMNSLP